MLVKHSRAWVKKSCYWGKYSYVWVEFSCLGEKNSWLWVKNNLPLYNNTPLWVGANGGASHSVGARKGVTLEKNDTLKKSLNLTVRKFYWIREKGVGIVNNVLKSSDNVGVKFTSLGEKSRCQLEYSCVYGWNFHVWVKNSWLGWKTSCLSATIPHCGWGQVRAWHSVRAPKGVTLEKNDTLQKSLYLTVRKFD